VQQRLGQEEELLIDPAFFLALKQHFPKIRQVQIQPKQGHHHNELTRFRYEAILHLEPETAISSPLIEIAWQDWQNHRLNNADIHKLLLEKEPMSLGLRRVDNKRLHTEVKTLEAFQKLAEGKLKTVGDLETSLIKQENFGIAPEDLWALGEKQPYEIHISWSSGYGDGSYDVVFKHCSVQGEVVFEEPMHSIKLMDWSRYGNAPLQGKLTQKLVPHLRQHLHEKLPEYMVPSFFILLEEMPLTPNGKIDRKALGQIDLTQNKQISSLILPRNSIELRLTSIWEESLDVYPVGVQDNFFELGGHSLLAISLMEKIQNCFGKSLPLASLLENPTVEKLASIISNQRTDSLNWSPLVPIQAQGSKPPLFFVPGSAMDVIEFYHLSHHLGSEQPFYGLQPRGLDGELEPYTRIEEMAAGYIKALLTVQPQGPYYLGGHSMGSTVVFEMSQQLIEQGHKVALLALIDTPAHIPVEKPEDIENSEAKALMLLALVRLIKKFFKKEVELSHDTLLVLDPDKQLDYVSEQLRIANLPVGTKQLQGFLKVCAADSEARAHYVQQNIYPVPVTLFKAEILSSEHLDLSDTWQEVLADSAWGWNNFSSGSVDLHLVPGDHITMMAEPYVITLAKHLRTCIDKTQTSNERA
jgi:thioesterase domain-containing protein/acyl carrier protein